MYGSIIWSGSLNANNVGNRPGEYTPDDTGLGTGKIQPQEDSIHLLEGPTRTMAGRSSPTVNNLTADKCMDRGKVAEHQHKQYR